MKRISAFEARVPQDERSDAHVGYFVNAADGTRATKGTGWWGADGTVRAVELIIFDTYEEYNGEQENKLREQALNKLNPQEREALGYK